MTTTSQHVIGGVDTHKDTHHAAVLTVAGQLLADRQFPATNRGHHALLDWLASFGTLDAVGIEGTSSYDAELTRVVTAAGIAIFEVNRPDRAARRRQGKSDQLDSEQAARSVLAGTATAIPKLKSGCVEVVRILRVTRSTAVKAKTQAMNALQSILVTAPNDLRDDLLHTRGRELIRRCSQLRPETSTLSDLLEHTDRLHTAAAKVALRDLARRWLALDRESKELTTQIRAIVEHIAPDLIALHGVGAEIAGQLLITPPATTSNVSPPRRRSPNSAGWHPNQPAAGSPLDDTDSAAAATVTPTAPSTSSQSPECDATNQPGSTWPDAPPKDSASARSSGASSDTLPVSWFAALPRTDLPAAAIQAA